MLAAVFYGCGDIRVEKRPKPIEKDNNIIAKVIYCAICGTDLKIATVGNPRCTPPRIIGHEFTGIITHVGKEVNGFNIGERITMATTIACHDCELCISGLSNMCSNAKPISYDFDGGFAEWIAIPPEAIKGRNIIKVPKSVSDEYASLAEPVSCAINGQYLAGIKENDTVLIIGGGPLGAIHSEVAKAYGASKVIISEPSEQRLNMLRKLEKVLFIDGAHNVGDIVKEQTNGIGADVVIVCAPVREAMEQSMNYARKGGSVSFFASLPNGSSEITFDSRTIHYSELRIVGASDSRPEHVQKAIDLMSEKKINLEHIITHKILLSDFHKGLELMKNRQCLKVLIKPGE